MPCTSSFPSQSNLPFSFPLLHCHILSSLTFSLTSSIYRPSFMIQPVHHLTHHQYPTMAHPNRPSLMSRLFPQEDRPPGRLSSTEDPSSSTLFSAEKAPFGSSSSASFQDESIRRNNLYQACFASFSNTAAEHRVQQDRAVEGDILEPLKSMSAIKSRQVFSSDTVSVRY